MRIGFIGTGGISEAIIRGMIGCANHVDPIFVSTRSASRSSRLEAEFQNVTAFDHNQEIVDRSDWLVLAVLPGQAENVISELKFSSTHTVISLVAGLEYQNLVNGLAPCVDICRMIPLPPIEFGVGPLPIYPAHGSITDFFSKLGTVIPVDQESWFTLFSANSALMANFFEWIAWQSRWMQEQGMPQSEAAQYACSFATGLATLAARCDAEQLEALSQECLTSGGLNEHVLNESLAMEWFERLRLPLDQVLKRLTTKS